MVTYDAQEWLLGSDAMIDLLNALNDLDDEGIITYNPASGWQIIPIIITYYRHRGWGAIKELGLEDYFRRWRTGV